MVQHMKKIAFVALVLTLSACGTSSYIPPTKVYKQPANTVTVNAPKDEVWRKLIAKLGKNSYVINSLEKDAGFLNFSYTGDPEPHVDCGILSYSFTNAVADETYTFPGAQKQADYHILRNPQLYRMHRVMALEGRTRRTG